MTRPPLSALQQLQMLQLGSSTLPVGGFTYSQGLEWAVEAGWVKGEAGFRQWQTEQIHGTLVQLDWPVLLRLYQACEAADVGAFERWTAMLLANRETTELRAEEGQRGAAFARLLAGWGLCRDEAWQPLVRHSQLGGMAWLAVHWRLPFEQIALAYGFGWLEAAVMAGVKLVPFGQQTAQTLIADLSTLMAEQLPVAQQLPDDELGAGFPLMAVASACHETQYSRLFRS